jgi:hypothetical protein
LNARALFTVAAIFNAVVGVAMLLAYDALVPWLDLPPQPTVWVHLVALVVLVFSYAYWRVAMEPRRFREYIVLGIVAKLAFVAVIYGHFLAGDATAMLAALVTADLGFAGLFGVHLMETRIDRRR